MKLMLRNLAKQLQGEVTTSPKVREYFSTDGSIFEITPDFLVYPKNEDDITLTVKMLNWQAQEGSVVPLTARGKGTDQSGAALGSGAMLVMPAHMKKLIAIDAQTITVQPGMIYSHMQSILQSHGRYLPPYPASVDFSTVGGAVANNAAGEKTIKYGSTRNWVKGLKVVLSNGDVITTTRLTSKQLQKKKLQVDYEGHLYREVDRILFENKDLLTKAQLSVSKNSSGYALWDIRKPDGSFDMSQLFIGSQGTLGIVSEICFNTLAYNAHTNLLSAHFESIAKLEEAVGHILKLKPSAVEMVDIHTLEFLAENKPEMLVGFDISSLPKAILLVEFDDPKPAVRNKSAKNAMQVLEHYASSVEGTSEQLKQQKLWRVRRSAAAVVWTHHGAKKALPIIEDGIVPAEKLDEYLTKAYKIFKKYNVKIASWGHAGNGNIHMQPMLDLANMRDRSKVFDITDDYYKMIISLGGSISAEHNDGIMRGVYLKQLFGRDVYKVFLQIKDLFDPLHFLNPTAKLNVTRQDAMVRMRKEYSMRHLFEHLPNSHFH